MSDAQPPSSPSPAGPPAGGGFPSPSWGPQPGAPGPWPGQPTGAPPPKGPRPHLSYWQFLLRTVTVAVVGPIVAFGFLFMSMVVLVALIGAVAGGTAAPATDDTVGPTRHVGGDDGAGDVVLVVRVDGPITVDGGGGGLFGGAVTGGYQVKRTLERAARDRDVKAVVVQFSTPGGSIAGSKAVADGMLAVKEAGKPVLAHVTDISASGGTYAMVAADRILVDEGGLVGSIGVILGPFQQFTGVVGTDGGLLGGGVQTTGGIDEFYFSAGTGKDAGNPFRPLTDGERARFQAIVDTSYAQFVDHVAANRPITADRIRGELGAQLFTGSEAVGLGLVDAVGSRDQAWEEAAKAAGLDRWDVREATGSTDVLSSLLGVGGTQPTAAQADLSSLCGPGVGALVYHGDLAGLCRAWGE